MRLVIASFNKYKIKEIKEILKDFKGIKILTLQNFKIKNLLIVEEKKNSYEENALHKARLVWAKLGVPTLAEDSGLEIKALSNLPGVISNRFLGIDNPRERNEKILQLMQAKKDRRAKFVSVVVLITQNGKAYTFKGECYGKISRQQLGDSGFGYDPIFIPQGYSETFSQLG
jgi:XTP/dITP diphosphohydrolase